MDARLYIYKQRSQSSVLIKQAKKNSFKCCHQFVHGLLCVCAIFRIKHVAKNISLLANYTPVWMEFFLQFSIANIVFMFLLHYTCRILCSINCRKAFKFSSKMSGFAVVQKSISSSLFCTQNNVFVVDEESRGWGIVSCCLPGGGE